MRTAYTIALGTVAVLLLIAAALVLARKAIDRWDERHTTPPAPLPPIRLDEVYVGSDGGPDDPLSLECQHGMCGGCDELSSPRGTWACACACHAESDVPIDGETVKLRRGVATPPELLADFAKRVPDQPAAIWCELQGREWGRIA